MNLRLAVKGFSFFFFLFLFLFFPFEIMVHSLALSLSLATTVGPFSRWRRRAKTPKIAPHLLACCAYYHDASHVLFCLIPLFLVPRGFPAREWMGNRMGWRARGEKKKMDSWCICLVTVFFLFLPGPLSVSWQGAERRHHWSFFGSFVGVALPERQWSRSPRAQRRTLSVSM
ncbi:hypothetical protein F5Y11DRAFT_310378 [Daldinia sp. FL1419]|nr:hypothetical protein F5Y11DRAFT_310378 [Daldinia sp. FL1419]